MEVIITINKEQVYDEVAKLTAYIGSKVAIEGAPLYNQVFTTPENQELLDRFWETSVDELIDTAGMFFSAQFEDNGDTNIAVSLPKDFDINKESALSLKAREYCISRIASKWMTITAPDQAEIYAAESQSALANYKAALYSRIVPKR